MIVCKREEAKRFSIAPGITNRILISGDRVMFLHIVMEPGSVVSLHSHPHEQMGICLRGKVEFQTEDKPVVVERDTVYVFKGNEKHGAKPVGKEAAILLEAFSPPREDYLAKVK